jgi:hypothetical protein
LQPKPADSAGNVEVLWCHGRSGVAERVHVAAGRVAVAVAGASLSTWFGLVWWVYLALAGSGEVTWPE